MRKSLSKGWVSTVDDLLLEYLDSMTQQQTEWSDDQLEELFKKVAQAIGEDLNQDAGLAKTKIPAYALLGQAVFGRRVRQVFKGDDESSLNHAYQMVRFLEKYL